MERNMNRSSSISEVLPEPILHHILSLLSQKDAVGTCVLSKSWLHLWYGRPQIIFRGSDFRGPCLNFSGETSTLCPCCFQEKTTTFLSTLDKTFQRYHAQKLSIQKIDLEMFEHNSQWSSLLEKWIPILIAPSTSLKTFSLSFSRFSFTNFALPCVVFQLKSLKKLCLDRCDVNIPTGVLLGCLCLQILSLKDVFISVDTLYTFMSSCPLLENVSLQYCKGLTAPNVIRIKHNNLKHLSFYAFLNQSDDDSPGIEIDAPNLISLFLQEVQLYPDYFKVLSSKFPRLEHLSVFFCKGHGELKLSSRSIKRLSLAVLRNSIKATVDLPNLRDFEFSGEFPETSFVFAKTTRSEWNSFVKLDFLEDFFDDGDVPWFRNLDVLRALRGSRISLNASYDSDFNQRMEEGDFNRERFVVENLRVRMWGSYAEGSASLPHFLNGLFSVCRPRCIQALDSQDRRGTSVSVNEYFDSQIVDFLCKVLVQEREKREYFWQKDLEEVGMEVWDKEMNEWNPKSLSDCELPSKRNIRFRLKWSDL